MYFMGWYTARMNETCSTDLLVSELNVRPDVAREIFGKLVREKAVHPPNALGISQTVDPFSNSIGRISQSTVARKVSRASERAKLREFGSEDVLLDEPEAEEQTSQELETPRQVSDAEEADRFVLEQVAEANIARPE